MSTREELIECLRYENGWGVRMSEQVAIEAAAMLAADAKRIEELESLLRPIANAYSPSVPIMLHAKTAKKINAALGAGRAGDA